MRRLYRRRWRRCAHRSGPEIADGRALREPRGQETALVSLARALRTGSSGHARHQRYHCRAGPSGLAAVGAREEALDRATGSRQRVTVDLAEINTKVRKEQPQIVLHEEIVKIVLHEDASEQHQAAQRGRACLDWRRTQAPE